MKTYDVVVEYTLDGEALEFATRVEAEDEKQAEFLGYRDVERDLIDNGSVVTWDCGCCIRPETGFELISIHVLKGE